MATIQYTTYTFNKPPLIDEKTYTIIKNRLKSTPDYDMFQIESFYEKYKVLILTYLIGGPISIFCVDSGIGFLEIISVFFLLILGFGLFSQIPEWISYASYLFERNKYYKNLNSNLKISNDYLHFRELML